MKGTDNIMLCENCSKNTATTHIHTVINGVSKKQHLCDSCANKLGYSTVQQTPFSNMFSSMLTELLGTQNSPEKKLCDVCGTSFSNIAKSGKVGCSNCYNTFYNELLPYIKRVHGSTVHMGKKPNSFSETSALVKVEKSNEDKINELKQQLAQHISKEEYELAAKIRDEIKSLQQEGN